MKTRREIVEALQNNTEFDVLVIGGGVNGIGTYRDLALQGLRVLLVEKGDYCSGASAGSSHMLHGGIRYLENGEFRLVREALHERNRMLKNAPHYAKPLPTTIPIFGWFSGFMNAPLKFLNLLDRPSERGAIVIKFGLMLYDWFTGSQQTMPYHKVSLKKASLERFPRMNPEIICTATYYDAWMPSPERICMDMLVDTDAASDQAFALNYARVTEAKANTVTLRDEVSGETWQTQPKVVVNAAGPWIDFVNRAMDQQTRFIGGTKGSHLILDHPELHAATGGSEIFFENDDGRIVLIFPYLNRVMVGTTDIHIEDPEEAVCTEEEIDYILGLIEKVFPDIPVDRSQIIYQFSGVRPLPASSDGYTGAISRDHSIKTVEAQSGLDFPIYSLVGGKWTTFRAFSEQSADVVLKKLSRERRTSTKELAIGGGKDFPVDERERQAWLDDLQKRVSSSRERLEMLLDRYGTRAAAIAQYIDANEDHPLTNLPEYSSAELAYLAQQEQVVHLDDLLQRRSLIAILGYLTRNAGCIDEIAQILADALGWDEQQRKAEIERLYAILEARHGYKRQQEHARISS